MEDKEKLEELEEKLKKLDIEMEKYKNIVPVGEPTMESKKRKEIMKELRDLLDSRDKRGSE